MAKHTREAMSGWHAGMSVGSLLWTPQLFLPHQPAYFKQYTCGNTAGWLRGQHEAHGGHLSWAI